MPIEPNQPDVATLYDEYKTREDLASAARTESRIAEKARDDARKRLGAAILAGPVRYGRTIAGRVHVLVAAHDFDERVDTYKLVPVELF